MTQEEFARLMGTSVATVARWEEERATPRPATLRKLERLQQVVASLQEITEPVNIPTWLLKPHRALNQHAPYELLDNEYGLEKVKDLIESIKLGNYS
jgi:transcriptional regulator with XRE-family HTH domain